MRGLVTRVVRRKSEWVQLDLTSLLSRASKIRWHSSPSEDMHRRGTDTGPTCDLVRVMRTVEKTIPVVPFGPTERVSLTDNATAATSILVMRLICVGPRSGHPALLLQCHVFPGRKRSNGEMHDGGRRRFRGGVRRELELCVNTVIRHLAAQTHTRTNKQTGHTCERIFILEHLAQMEDAQEGRRRRTLVLPIW